jgi:hypothetical protein
MITIPSSVRVWIATGHTDMRRGMQGLALTVQEQLKREGISISSVAVAAIWPRFCVMTAPGCRFTPTKFILHLPQLQLMILAPWPS